MWRQAPPITREAQTLNMIDPADIEAGMRIEITQAFVTQLRAVYTGEVTAVTNTYKLPGLWLVLNGVHYFQCSVRASYADRTCTQTFKSLRPVEPPDKSMWLVVVGLIRQVWIRDDSVLAKTLVAAKEGRHWYRVGERHGYTWTEAFEVMDGRPMMRLKVDHGDSDQ